MYEKRIKIFVILSCLLLLICLLRLTQMQLLPSSSVQHDIEELKRQRGQSQQLKTVRGKILDRTGNVEKAIATDEPQFQLCINYSLSSLMDDRVREGMLLRAVEKDNPDAVAKVQKKLDSGMADLNQIINKCAQFKAVDPSEIKNEIQSINDHIWNQRLFQAWRRKFPNSEVRNEYKSIISIPMYEAVTDFEKKEPDSLERIRLVNKIDIADMYNPWPLLELKTDDDIFAAQLEFLNVEGIQILPKARRFYPYGTVAAQTIGWVSPVTQYEDKKLFEDDKLLSYLEGELGGREDGVEYVCESILRGRRGEEVIDIDSQLIHRTDIEFGKDVSLTLDIELQQRIENYLTDYPHEPNCGPGMSAVIIEVGTGDILALVSLPTFDLNRARYDYDILIADANKPLINRAINKRYPPGSVVKPLILIAGLESKKITPGEAISCPARPAPNNWPNCLIFNRYRSGHDLKWEHNNARNAIKGSCNIYFSRLADRIDPLTLQQYLFMFGYGRNILLPPLSNAEAELNRNLRQLPGVISNIAPRGRITTFEQVPPLIERERRWFGIGQGNLRVTPLQVANSMAAIARGGIYKPPRLFLDDSNDSRFDAVNLGISSETMAIIYDGMSAVVNEVDGTAHRTFAPVLKDFAAQDVKIYGKTGSTEAPEDAWFGGFVTDSTKRAIAIAIVVEGGQHGSSDAAPLGRDIIQFCIESGYIGKSPSQSN
jgi:penicillin-binding protein 2